MGIVLAAGRGDRIGQPKAWLRTDREGECFFGRACARLTDGGAERVIGLIPPGGEAFAHRASPGAVLVVNRWPEEGQLSSLQLGLRALSALDLDAEAAIVFPVDAPLVTAATIRALVARWHESGPAVIRPVDRRGRHGHPVIFAARLFEPLLSADAAAGAKPIVRAHATPTGDVLVEDDGAFLDIDTPEDYVQAFNRSPESSFQ